MVGIRWGFRILHNEEPYALGETQFLIFKVTSYYHTQLEKIKLSWSV
jgi:hypothetical protein